MARHPSFLYEIVFLLGLFADGRRVSSYRAHRGGDLLRWKDAAVDRLSSAEVFCTLTMTASLGVNDHEIGAVDEPVRKPPGTWPVAAELGFLSQ